VGAALGQLEIVGERSVRVHHRCTEITLDLREVPFDVETFYTLLSFPEYLCNARAARRRSCRSCRSSEIDMWDSSFRSTRPHLTSTPGKRRRHPLDQYVRTANDMLFNLQATLERITDEYKRQAAAETGGDGQTGLGKSGGAGTDEWVERGMFERKPRSSVHGSTLLRAIR